jgi:hypothetical protein
MNSGTRFTKSALHNAVLLALGINGALVGTGIAHAASEVCANPGPAASDSANFTMLSAGGGVVGGTNDVATTWDGTAYNNSSDYQGPGVATVDNVTATSTAPFFGHAWTAHDIQMFLPGTYSFDTTLSDGRPNQANETGSLNVTVPAGSLGMHMLFDWNNNNNIDVFVVVTPDSIFGSGLLYSTVTNTKGQFKCDSNFTGAITQNCLYDGALYGSAGAPTKNQTWMLAAVDGNGDGVMGIPMPSGGPFQGFNANFNLRGAFAGLNLQNTCAGFVDMSPDPINFTPVTDAALNTQFESNVVTISGLGTGVNVNISVTGGEYRINGGAYTSTAGTVTNGNTVQVRGTSPSANGQTTTVVLTVGSGGGNFTISTPAIVGAQGSNFTMLDSSNGVVGGTNDVVAIWDGTFDTNVNSTVFNRMTLSSITPFFQFNWTAHHIRVFGPGTYTINTTCTTGQLEAGTCTASANPAENYVFTVGAGQIGAHMLFNWNVSANIDVVNVWNQDQVFGPSAMHTGSGACNSASTVWDLMSTNWDGDSINGGKMIDGPFMGFSANFNVRLPGSPILACSEYVPTVNVGSPRVGGCSLSTAPVSPARRGDWWLLAGFVAWLGALRFRSSRTVKA